MRNIKDYEAMAKFDMPEAERAWVSDRADMLIDSFSVLDGIDTSGTEPLVAVLDVYNVFREDAAVKFIPRDELMSGAPEQRDRKSVV